MVTHGYRRSHPLPQLEINTMSEPVLISAQQGVAEIRFNRPDALNAIDVPTALAFRDAVAAAAASSARVIVLAGTGRAFVAGGDLAYFRAAGEKAPEAARELIVPMNDAIKALAAASQPVVASLHGPVAGAGMSVALAADLAIAADDVVFNMAYVKVGTSLDCSGSWTLPRIVGLRKALEIALLSDSIDANEALRLGMVNRVVPVALLEDATRQLSQRLAAAAPLALGSIKRLLHDGWNRSLHAQLDAELESFARNAGSADFHEALEAFFTKRKPQFTGR